MLLVNVLYLCVTNNHPSFIYRRNSFKGIHSTLLLNTFQWLIKEIHHTKYPLYTIYPATPTKRKYDKTNKVFRF